MGLAVVELLARAPQGINIPLRLVPAKPMPTMAVSLPATAPTTASAFAAFIPAAKPPLPPQCPPSWLSHLRHGPEGGPSMAEDGFWWAMKLPAMLAALLALLQERSSSVRHFCSHFEVTPAASGGAWITHVPRHLCFCATQMPLLDATRVGYRDGGDTLVFPGSSWTRWVKPTEVLPLHPTK